MSVVIQMTNSDQLTNKLHEDFKRTNDKINQYACKRCRRLKKKCSKEFPKCINCVRQNETCEYVERKNKRKKLNPYSSINGNSNSINENENENENEIENENENEVDHKNEHENEHEHKHENHTEVCDGNPNEINRLSKSSNNPIDLSSKNRISSRSSISIPNSITNLISKPAVNSITNPLPSSQYLSSAYLLPSFKLDNLKIKDGVSTSLSLYSLQQQQSAVRGGVQIQQSNNLSNYLPIPSFNQIENQSFIAKPSLLSSLNNKININNNINNINSNIIGSASNKIPSINKLYQFCPENNIFMQSLVFMFNQFNLVDENLVIEFIDKDVFNASISWFMLNITPIYIFLDDTMILRKIKELENYILNIDTELKDFEIGNQDDYASLIELNLILAIGFLGSNISSKKFTCHTYFFTKAHKVLTSCKYNLTNIQILRIMMLIQIFSNFLIENNSNSWFIIKNLSIFSKKLFIHKLFKDDNLNQRTLSEIEYSNRLFWSIYTTDVFYSSAFGSLSSFDSRDINTPLPQPITKDEEFKINFQKILINFAKIESNILSNIYITNSKIIYPNENDRNSILNSLGHDIDSWYNDSSLTLSKLELSSYTSNEIKLNNSIWVSQGYYYLLFELYRPSNLFPSSKNYSILAKSTLENLNFIFNNLQDRLSPIFWTLIYRFPVICNVVLFLICKGKFGFSEVKSSIRLCIQIWDNWSDFCNFAIESSNCFKKIEKILARYFKINKLSDGIDYNVDNDEANFLPNNELLVIFRNYINILKLNEIDCYIDPDFFSNDS